MLFHGAGTGLPHLSLAGEDIEDDDAHHAGYQITRGGDGETEAAPARKAQRLIARADIVGLAGALPEAQG